jgi:beta-glucosidase
MGQIPLYYNALSTGRPAGEVDLSHPPTNSKEKFVSRYVDEQDAPQFPFGFGLSYTTFQYSNPEASSKTLSAKTLNELLRNRAASSREVLSASATVTNSGKVAAEEVVQLYVGLRGTSVAEPVRALKGFQRVALAPGESRKITFALTAGSFALWDIHNDYNVEPSHVNIWISPDSANGEPVTLDIIQ